MSSSQADVQNIVAAQNINQGAGKLISDQKETVLKVKADAISVEDLQELILKPGLKLKDVARVIDGLSDSSSYSSYSGNQGVMLEVKKISGENVLNIIKGVKKVKM